MTSIKVALEQGDGYPIAHPIGARVPEGLAPSTGVPAKSRARTSMRLCDTHYWVGGDAAPRSERGVSRSRNRGWSQGRLPVALPSPTSPSPFLPPFAVPTGSSNGVLR